MISRHVEMVQVVEGCLPPAAQLLPTAINRLLQLLRLKRLRIGRRIHLEPPVVAATEEHGVDVSQPDLEIDTFVRGDEMRTEREPVIGVEIVDSPAPIERLAGIEDCDKAPGVRRVRSMEIHAATGKRVACPLRSD